MNRIKHFLHIHEIQEKKASDRSEPLRHADFPGKKMAESGLLPDLTLDEINEEIRLAREEKAAREKAKV